MPPRRSRSSVSRRRAFKTGGRVGNAKYVASARFSRYPFKSLKINRALAGVSRLTRMIETKHCTRRIVNQQLAHNNVGVLSLNPFVLQFGAGDDESMNTGSRIGDRITVGGLTIKAFLENSLGRSKVYWRVMLIKCAKGDPITRADLFQNSSDNKMIDTINTERYTVVAQKIFNIQPSDSAPLNLANLTGIVSAASQAGNATRVLSMYIPGRKFGRNGVVQYENNNQTGQVKFFDYRICIVCYDWYGTPQDTNNVGFINEMYTKMSFKDA